MSIAEGKRRFTVSLTASNVERFQKLAKQFKMPPNQMSITCDDAIREISEMMQAANDAGTFTIKDVFAFMGKQMELLLEEERANNAKVRQKRNTIPNSKGH